MGSMSKRRALPKQTHTTPPVGLPDDLADMLNAHIRTLKANDPEADTSVASVVRRALRAYLGERAA